MPRTERILFVAALLVARRVPAHGLHQYEGTLVVERDSVVTTVDVEQGSERRLVDELVVRDAAGARLPGRLVSVRAWTDDVHATCLVEHALPPDARWLVLQLRPDAARAALARRLTLAVTARGGPPTVVELTSGGNVEVVRLDGVSRAIETACGPTLLDEGPERRSSIQALLDVRSSGSRLDVVMPLGVLESFTPLARKSADFLEIEEQEAARAALLELVRSRLALAVDDREIVPARAEVALLGLDDPAIGLPPAPRRLGAWTARARVTLLHDVPAARRLALRWDLFNALVLSARVVVVDGERCEQRQLSTYAPTLEWAR